MRRKRADKNKNFFGIVEFNKLIIMISAGIFALGVIMGAFILNSIDIEYMDKLLYSWDIFIKGEMSGEFIDKFFKSVIIILIIWLCGFFRLGFAVTAVIILIKGISVGFTSAFITKASENGILEIFSIYGFWNFALTALCFIATVLSVKKSFSKSQKGKNKNYFAAGIVMFAAAVTLAL